MVLWARLGNPHEIGDPQQSPKFRTSTRRVDCSVWLNHQREECDQESVFLWPWTISRAVKHTVPCRTHWKAAMCNRNGPQRRWVTTMTIYVLWSLKILAKWKSLRITNATEDSCFEHRLPLSQGSSNYRIFHVRLVMDSRESFLRIIILCPRGWGLGVGLTTLPCLLLPNRG
jgi:hypothetical protein